MIQEDIEKFDTEIAKLAKIHKIPINVDFWATVKLCEALFEELVATKGE